MSGLDELERQREQAMSDAGQNHVEHGDQNRPEDHADSAGTARPGGPGSARPVREYRMSGGDRVGNTIFSVLARVGIGPAHLLTTRGRKTGRPRTIPVILVQQDDRRWLVAPYGAVSWVLNARAAGRVTLRRGRDRQDYTIREISPAESGPVLKRYIQVATAARPYFQAGKDSPVDDFIAEAHRHPVFELIPTGGDQRRQHCTGANGQKQAFELPANRRDVAACRAPQERRAPVRIGAHRRQQRSSRRRG